MADEQSQNTGASQSTGATPTGTPAQGTGNAIASQNAADSWNSKYQSPEQMWDAYKSLEQKLGTQGQEIGKYKEAYQNIAGQYQDYERAVKAWDDWYKRDISPHWDKIQKFIANGGQMPQQQQVPNPTTQNGTTPQQIAQWAQGWEALTPQQQAERLGEVSSNYAAQNVARALAPELQKWQQRVMSEMQQNLAEKEAYYNNYLNLYRKVMDMRIQDPTVNVDEVLDNAVKVLSGQQDPLTLGRTLATMGSDKESYAKQMVEQARKDWETEQQNKQMAAMKTQESGSSPVFKRPISPPDGKRTLAARRDDVQKTLLEKYGPSIFS